MIAKVCFLLAAVAAAQATLLATGHLGAISAQSTAINHIAPVGYAAPLAIGHGMLAGPYGYGLGASNLGLGHGLGAGNLRADGIVGHGILGSRYGNAIAHNAVVGHGIVGGVRYGGLLGLGHGIVGGVRYGGLLGLGHGIGLGKAIL